MTGVWIAALALAIGALALQGAWRSRRDLVRWLGIDPRSRRRSARAFGLALAASLLGWGLVHVLDRPPDLGGAGADMVIAVDVSQSMNVADTAPSRLRRAVRLAERVVGEARAVRIGLVLFAGDAFMALPLTQDRDAVLTYLGALDTELITRRGTNLAGAIDVAAGVFDPRSDRPRRILLLSDGENGERGLEAALGRAQSAGVQIVPVGFGTVPGGEVIARGGQPVLGPAGGAVASVRDDTTLRRIATATDGYYYRELEDEPRASRLLPTPSPTGSPEPRPRDGIFTSAILFAALLLAAELALSIRLFASRGRRRLFPWRGSAPLLRQGTRGLVLLLGSTLLVGMASFSLRDQADQLLAQNKAREALSIYRKIERIAGRSAASRLRVGNALFRLEQKDGAVAAYLSVLRKYSTDDTDARFVAAYNMGTVLIAQKRYAEASDALWTALLERPDDLQAKFNYEWAREHTPPDPEIPPSSSPEVSEDGEEQESDPSPDEAEKETEQERPGNDLLEAEAERWLRTIEEAPDEPLRRQIADQLESKPSTSGARQSW